MRFVLLLAALAASVTACRDLAAAPQVFAPDRFTMLDIVPFARGGEDAAARDMVEYAARTGNTIALYSLTLHPEGVPASVKVDVAVESYRRFAKALEGTSVRPGILLQAILGHWPRTDREIEPWQRTINVSGEAVRFCPLDPRFRAYIRETAEKLARCRPCLILSDDDVRSFSPKAECFCPLHTAEFNRRAGTSFTPDALRNCIAKAPQSSREHGIFSELQRETIVGVCKLIREGISAVDPSIPAGVCQPGWVCEHPRVPHYARAIAAPGQRPFLRLANGKYTESSPKWDLHPNVLATATAIIEAGSDVYLLDESDTWPHNTWAKSAAAFHAKLVTGAFAGLKGAKMWYVNCHEHGYPISRNYTDILAEHAGYYDALAVASSQSRPDGLLIPCHRGFPFQSVVSTARIMPYDDESWAQNVFGLFGVPYRPTYDYTEGGIYAVAGANAVARFSDAEMRQLLSRRILVDGEAAVALVKRGFGDLIGVTLSDGKSKYTEERDEATGGDIVFTMSSKAPIFAAASGTRVLSSLVWRPYSGADDFTRVAPAATLCTNELGGTVLVTAYHMHMGGPYCHSEARKAWLERRLADLNGGAPLDNVAGNQQNVLTMVRRTDDGADLVLFTNLNFDPLRGVRLTHARKPASVEALGKHGAWETIASSWSDGVLNVDIDLPCYAEKVFRIR